MKNPKYKEGQKIGRQDRPGYLVIEYLGADYPAGCDWKEHRYLLQCDKHGDEFKMFQGAIAKVLMGHWIPCPACSEEHRNRPRKPTPVARWIQKIAYGPWINSTG